jgi:hypothetical protein
MAISNILNLPDFQHALKVSDVASLMLATAKAYLLFFGLISFLFIILEKLFARRLFFKILGLLTLLLFGVVGSVLYRFEYYTEPFVTAVLLRGLVFSLLLAILYLIMTRLKGAYWLIVSLLLLTILPLMGILQDPFPAARPAYLVSYLIIAASFLYLGRKKKKRK